MSGQKAGDLVTGFEKVSEALRKDKAAFILEAKDAGADGHAKMLSLAKGVEVFALYDVEELDKALDRVNTVHAAFLKTGCLTWFIRSLKDWTSF